MVKKPVLIKVGKHLINPNDIACISKCRDRVDDESGERYPLYIIKLVSNPNPQFPIWVREEKEIEKLMKNFEVK